MTHTENDKPTNTDAGQASSRKQLAFSFVWAALIIASALVIKDQKSATIMLFLLIAGWVVTLPYVGSFKQMMACERRAMRRLMGFRNT